MWVSFRSGIKQYTLTFPVKAIEMLWNSDIPSYPPHFCLPQTTVISGSYLVPLSFQCTKNFEFWQKQWSDIIQSFISVSQQNSSCNKLNTISFPIMNLSHGKFMSLQTPPQLLSFSQVSYLHAVKTNSSGYFWPGGCFTFPCLPWSLVILVDSKFLGVQVVHCLWPLLWWLMHPIRIIPNSRGALHVKIHTQNKLGSP